MATSSSCRRVVLLALFSVLLAGCGGGGQELAPVSGTVTLDGKPLAGAGVLFTPQEGGRPAGGSTDEEGRFTLTTKTNGDGAMLGTNRVAVSKVAFAQTPSSNGSPNPSAALRPQSLIPARYGDVKTSGLVVEVTAGMEPVKLELQSK